MEFHSYYIYIFAAKNFINVFKCVYTVIGALTESHLKEEGGLLFCKSRKRLYKRKENTLIKYVF